MNTIKKLTIVALTTAIASQTAFADSRVKKQEVKGGLTFAGATIVGGMAGGPIGAFIGAITGAYFGEHGRKSVENEIALEETYMALSDFEQQIDHQYNEISSLEKMIAEKMKFQMHFKTGEQSVSLDDMERIQVLSDFLSENDYMHVTIDGHADIRGDDESNKTLSEARANAVADVLTSSGVDAERITTKGHGSNFANNTPANSDDYALDRKVKIQIFPSKGGANLAFVD